MNAELAFLPAWPVYTRWRSEFAKAIDEALYPLTWLDQQVWTGAVMFDYEPDAATISEYHAYPSGLFAVQGLVAAGNPETIRTVLIPRVNERAKSVGAVVSIIESRPAWARLLKGDGYEPHQLTIRKAL